LSKWFIPAHGSFKRGPELSISVIDEHRIVKDQPIMIEQTQKEIRDRAYELWQAEGCAEGKDMDFWLQAEKEILGAPSMAPTIPPANGNGAAEAKPAAERKPVAKKATGTKAAKKPAAKKTAAAKAPAKPRASKTPTAKKSTTTDAS